MHLLPFKTISHLSCYRSTHI